jgi:hypothetical protein
MLCHLVAFAGYVFPMGHIIGPLVIYLLKREQYPLVEDQGKESLNFQISVTIYVAAALLLSLAIIGIPLLIALLIFHFIVVLLATIRADRGERYRYPLSIRLIT